MIIQGMDSEKDFYYNDFNLFIQETTNIECLLIANDLPSLFQIAQLNDLISKENKLNEISFSNITLNINNVNYIANLIISSSNLTTVNFVSCNISPEALKILVLAIKSKSTINSIDFSGCNVGDLGVQKIIKSLNPNNLKSLILAGNNISDIGIAFICNFVANSNKLKHLDLRYNNINPNNQLMLVEAINKTESLSELLITVDDNLVQQLPSLLYFNNNPTPLCNNAYYILELLENDNLNISDTVINNFQAYSDNILRILLEYRNMNRDEAQDYIVDLATKIKNHLDTQSKSFANFIADYSLGLDEPAAKRRKILDSSSASEIDIVNQAVLPQTDSETDNQENVLAIPKNYVPTQEYKSPKRNSFREALSPVKPGNQVGV